MLEAQAGVLLLQAFAAQWCLPSGPLMSLLTAVFSSASAVFTWDTPCPQIRPTKATRKELMITGKVQYSSKSHKVFCCQVK